MKDKLAATSNPRAQLSERHRVAQISGMLTLSVVCYGCAGGAGSEPPPAAPEPPEASAPLPMQAAEPASEPEKTPAISEAEFGVHDGKPVKLFTLTNANGLVLKAMTYGAIITEFQVPDKAGNKADIVLGFDSLNGYVEGNPYFGATVGRVANRIKNAKFTLQGKQYKLAANDAPHHLHGGAKGWDKVVWDAEAVETPNGPQLNFSYVSPDGQEGYPGTVTAKATYTLTNQDELRVEMQATTDKTTLVNMVHHSYWNLGGHASGTVEDHELTLMADKYTPPNGLVPEGGIKPVKGTPFDFTTPKPIGNDLKAAGGKPVGFDHNWVVNGEPTELRMVAKLKHPASGRVMTLEADQPGVQFYSGNFLDGSTVGKGGTAYAQYAGLCLESQKFPNSINVPAWKEEVILKPGATYRHTMVHRFSVE
jgi:aldose 1-epimerase